jgi:hypothetical protein
MVIGDRRSYSFDALRKRGDDLSGVDVQMVDVQMVCIFPVEYLLYKDLYKIFMPF